MNNTKASEETTKNFVEAMESYLNNPPPKQTLVTKLLYRNDGTIIGITEDSVAENQPWIPVDRKEFESSYGSATKWLKVIDGKIVNTKIKPTKNELNLKSGNTWQADKTFRLVAGEENSKDTDGWSKKSDS